MNFSVIVVRFLRLTTARGSILRFHIVNDSSGIFYGYSDVVDMRYFASFARSES